MFRKYAANLQENTHAEVRFQQSCKTTLGAIQILSHRDKEGGRYPKLVTKSDLGERGVHANSDITTKKKICTNFYFPLDFGQRRLSFGYFPGGDAVSKIGLSPFVQAEQSLIFT